MEIAQYNMNMNYILNMTLLLLFISACTAGNNPFGMNARDQVAESQGTFVVPGCDLKPIQVPTLPSVIPEYTELDRVTGLHMTGTVQEIDFPSYRLRVTGLVEQPLSLHYDELRCLPKVTANPPLTCTGIFEDFTDIANWSGVPLFEILKLARLLPQAKSVSLISADGFKEDIPIEDALNPENFLAYEWEGQPIPVLHGFPVRAVFPNKIGSFWVKWLVEIKVN
jgi:DMSO/TMAO reductase YedYZ molybdopterin-dependent catalytic subunit